MKFLTSLTELQVVGPRISGILDQTHRLTLEALSPTVVRLLIQKAGSCRLGRTWSVAQGEDSVPLEGHSRLNLPGDRVAMTLDDHTAKVGEVSVRLNTEPYFLEWSFQGREVLKERKTGAVALGRRDHRLWHFHQLRAQSRFYGLGERTGEIDRRGRSFEMRNVDPMGYDAKTSDPLYKHIPFYIDHHENGYVGLFYDNYANARFNFGEEIDNYHGPFTSYRAEDGDLDLYLFFGETLLDITRQFSWLTGRTYLPPKWSLGYSTTSMTYTDVDQAQERVEQFLRESEEHDIPVKTFKFGSGYTSRDGKRYVFTWNRDKFPDPQSLMEKFHARNIRLNANIKPVLLKDHPDYEACQTLFVQDSDGGGQEVSQFWDNEGSHLDFTNPDTIAWWQERAKSQLLDYGVDALWNDNNEYVIWDDEAVCHGFGSPIPIALIRPLMSLWMTRASHEITQAQNPGKRVWSISRCGCPGLQRYAQTWSGDNLTCWQTLEYNNKMALGLSLSGIYNIGHDVGGFAGPAPEPELLARWFFIGAFTPRFGVNSWKPDGTITEPWMYPEVLPAIKKALALRMRFMPQLYSLMVQSCQDYTPLLRPTFLNFPDDPNCLTHDTEFMWGENLLIAPVLAAGERKRQVYLPRTPAGWWDWERATHFEGGQLVEVKAELDSVPLFVKGGSCLFLAAPSVDSIDGPETERELHVFPGSPSFTASFYDDDGETLAYRQGVVLEMRIRVQQTKEYLDLNIESKGEYVPDYSRLRIVAPSGFDLSHETWDLGAM